MSNVFKKWATVILFYKLGKNITEKKTSIRDNVKSAVHVNPKIKCYALLVVSFFKN